MNILYNIIESLVMGGMRCLLFDSVLWKKFQIKCAIKNINRWEKVSDGNFRYLRNYKITMRLEVEEINEKNLNCLNNYQELVRDFPLSEDVWELKKRPMDCSGEESFSWFKVVLHYENTEVLSFEIMKLFLKHYPELGDIYEFFLPSGINRMFHNLPNKSIKNIQGHLLSDEVYIACKLLYRLYNKDDSDINRVFSILNYDLLSDPLYLRKKDTFLRKNRD